MFWSSMFRRLGKPEPHSGGRLLCMRASVNLKLVTLAHLAPQSDGICPYKVLPGRLMVLRYAPRAPHESENMPAASRASVHLAAVPTHCVMLQAVAHADAH